MFVTVAICTWNRAKLLDRTLNQMRELRIPDGVTWELLVVNNNCTDETDAVLAKYGDQLPLRRLVETKQGHSHARNCAIDHARGELLIWTDDDVLVDREWLAEYVKAAEAHPDAGYFGGTIDPWFESEPPRWIRRELKTLGGPYVICQHGEVVRPRGRREKIAGANMGFRMDVLRQFPFNTDLGRVRGLLVGGDDCDVLDRVEDAGHKGLWIGTARVQHFIPSERLTAAFVWKWYLGAGHTAVRQQLVPTSTAQIFGAPRWAVRQYLQARVKSLVLAPLRGPRWFEAFLRAARLRGIVEAFRAMLQAEAQLPAVAPNGHRAGHAAAEAVKEAV
jgi:glycosyltransferase involved in cell wall biosynthesis